MLALAASLLLFAPLSHAGQTDLGLRLKAAGVPEPLQRKITAAIAAGAKDLLRYQRGDGAFVETRRSPGWISDTVGTTLLCAVALKHAGEAVAVEKAMAWLMRSANLSDVTLQVYHSSLMLMLLDGRSGADAQRRLLARNLIDAMGKDSGFWGYATGDFARRAVGGAGTESPNMSTSQFAALGLWCAKRSGVEADLAVWRRHGEALCAVQFPDGSWPYWLGRKLPEVDGVSLSSEGSMTATAMALSNLAIARHVIASSGTTEEPVLEKIDAAYRRGLLSLGMDASAFLLSPKDGEVVHAKSGVGRRLPAGEPASGRGTYYSLFTLEKALLFAGREEIEDARRPPEKVGKSVRWYVSGATWLLSEQNVDGGWVASPAQGLALMSNLVDTAFALLFLERAPTAFRPTTVTGDAGSLPRQDGGPR